MYRIASIKASDRSSQYNFIFYASGERAHSVQS